MEKWEEYKKGTIRKDDYESHIEFGETEGLTVTLIGKNAKVKMSFGNVFSFRVIEEGYVQSDIYSEEEVRRFCENGFSNVIYLITDGTYASEIEKISGGYLEAMRYYHFVLITLNYNIDIVAMDEPQISEE